jgi:hypothetical protein
MVNLNGELQRVVDRIRPLAFPILDEGTLIKEIDDDLVNLTVPIATEFHLFDIIDNNEGTETPVSIALPIDLYLSTSGVKLLNAVQKEKPLTLTIFLEVGNDHDLFSPPVFEIAVHTSKDESSPDNLSTSDFFSLTAHLRPVFMSELGLSDAEYRNLVESRFSNPGKVVVNIAKLISEGAAQAIDLLHGLFEGLSKVFDKGKLPQELWNKRFQPAEIKQAIADVGRAINTIMEQFLAWVGKLSSIKATELIDNIPGIDLLPDALRAIVGRLRAFLEKIDETLLRIKTFVDNVATSIRDALGEIPERIDALIAYFCGVWDALAGDHAADASGR